MFLFKISKKGKSAILFGTVHSCNWKFVPEPIKQILLSADVLVGEHGSVSNKIKEKFSFFKQNKSEKSLFHNLATEFKDANTIFLKENKNITKISFLISI